MDYHGAMTGGEIITPELLAPAGSSEALHAAIAAGADAIYLGGRRFGARHFAPNFSDDILADAVSYAHIRGVKIYITVNTLIHDDEIPELLEYILFLCATGIDAILIQDMGILSLLRDIFLNLEGLPALHASTQMAVHNQEGALYASDRGCTRIVIARELPMHEIRAISLILREKGTGIEIFVHGALCYAFSGQCLLSAVIGGRSGNRGMCAQPCRKPYVLLKGKPDRYGRLTEEKRVHLQDKFLLSTRDLSTYPVLKAVADLPVEALKIEGRMRSTHYVAIVTDIYRRALDAIESGVFIPKSEEVTDLAIAFSRGFTTGYLNNERCQTVMGRDLPGRRGILVGTVINPDQNGFLIIEPAGDIIPERGDGMVCMSGDDELGFVLRRDSVFHGGKIAMESGIRCRKGDVIYLTSRGRANRAVETLLKDPDQRFSGSILINLRIIISDQGMVDIFCEVYTRKGLNFSFSFRSEHTFSLARTRPLSAEQIAMAIRKTGGTLYCIGSLDISCPDGLFAPVSVLNGIRREIIGKTENKIVELGKPSDEILKILQNRIESLYNTVSAGKDSNHQDKQLPLIFSVVSDLFSVKSALEGGADRVYIEWYPVDDRKESFATLKDILENCHSIPEYTSKIGIKLPKIIMRSELDILYKYIPDITTSGIRHIMVDGIGIAEALWNQYNELIIAGYSGLNITNHLSLSSYSGYDFLTLSCELSGKEILATTKLAEATGNKTPIAIICQGLLEAMITADHLTGLAETEMSDNSIFGIRDQKGETFPIFTDPSNRTHIFNSAETSLIDKIPEMRKAGVQILIIDGRMRGPEYMNTMVTIWKKAALIAETEWSPAIINNLKDEIKNLAWGSLTAATWKRGLTSL